MAPGIFVPLVLNRELTRLVASPSSRVGEHLRVLPRPPECPKTMAQHPKIESMDSIESITLGLLEVQVGRHIPKHWYCLEDQPAGTIGYGLVTMKCFPA